MMRKKYLTLGILAILTIFIRTQPIYAQSCGFGATPLSARASAIPGQKVVVTWNLYNMYSDRKTHILINYTSDVGWKVTIEPQARNVSYELPAGIVTILENLALDPLPPVQYKPEVIPYGVNYVKHPTADLYIPAKTVTFTIEVPTDAKIGERHTFHFKAKGECFLGTGAVIPALELGLDLTIDVVSPEFYERELISGAPWYLQYAWAIVTAALLVIAVVTLIILRRRRIPT
ncbi:MAG: hypothetical protein OH339_02110 [Candidatus Parvarchaeota archaeon]|nr:hypothetical protein [Candidatus Haiyanarchaeum thermophilum]MCW1303862.1 hypothetical protein [Candidatus Haiyanarchaeum thermophilum]MCW1306522.1 hypothetical protein [Candidatus Haiyanarchaeum thermophilum]MCW1306935.1 hypothetical protein [Candidatus Haiyanarchaeum thermophilum]